MQIKNRLRRGRSSAALRDLLRETTLSKNDFIFPLFIKDGKGIKEEISSMPGQYRFSVDTIGEEIESLQKLGLKSVLLFGLASKKDAQGSDSLREDGPVQETIRLIKRHAPEMLVMTDVCVCGYTDHGHCGVVENGLIHNDKSLLILRDMALSHSQAGADIIAPSAMMDGQIEAIRDVLDAGGFADTGLMAYASKFYSACYGPFREAADSAPQFGNRATYQMDVANRNEALREILSDEEEGADILMVKPAAFYLDIIRDAAESSLLPIAAYNVSGEYSMVKAAAANGWIDGERVMLEMLLSMKRAGAKLLITYFAKEAARII